MARILVVDDDTAVRTFVRRALAHRGHETAAAGDGAEALALIQGDPAFDLVVSDIVMPALDGIELVATLAEQRPALPVILMTAHADQARLATARPREVILKPFSLKDICTVVARNLESDPPPG